MIMIDSLELSIAQDFLNRKYDKHILKKHLLLLNFEQWNNGKYTNSFANSLISLTLNLAFHFFIKLLFFKRNYWHIYQLYYWLIKVKGRPSCYCFDTAWGSWRLSLFQLKLTAIYYVIKLLRSAFLLLSRDFTFFFIFFQLTFSRV